MKNWIEDLIAEVKQDNDSYLIFEKIALAAEELGFEYCSYGVKTPVPFTNPKIVLVNNYPAAWQERYRKAGYIALDPTVAHGMRSRTPLTWSDAVFADQPQFWSEAQSYGLRYGWTQSSVDSNRLAGMLSLARSAGPLSGVELEEKQARMSALAHLAHFALGQQLMQHASDTPGKNLTNREVEILRWSADGKTSSEISQILLISVDTVNFHVKNAVTKLQSANKMAAVVRAAVLGLLH